jgi:hypothetical protein
MVVYVTLNGVYTTFLYFMVAIQAFYALKDVLGNTMCFIIALSL